MKKLNTRTIGAIALIAGLAAFGNVNAASTWTFTGGVDGSDATTSGAAYNKADGNLSIGGAFAANGASNSGFASGATWAVNNVGSSTTNNSTLKFYTTGLGMWSDGNSAPNRAIDNSGTNTEAVILTFTNSVVLTNIVLGSPIGDADVSLWRYTKTVGPTIAGTGATKAQMITAGWELVGNNDLTSSGAVNSGGWGSSWWMISAYNSGYGTGSGLSQGDDFFNISAVVGNQCTSTANGVCSGSRVPEPSSIALLGLGLLGIYGARKRRLADASA